jgi:hypothetical protein
MACLPGRKRDLVDRPKRCERPAFRADGFITFEDFNAAVTAFEAGC